jgi:hypothetical protein
MEMGASMGLVLENILKSLGLGKDQSSIDTVSIPMIFYRNLVLDNTRREEIRVEQTGFSFSGIWAK